MFADEQAEAWFDRKTNYTARTIAEDVFDRRFAALFSGPKGARLAAALRAAIEATDLEIEAADAEASQPGLTRSPPEK